MGGEKLGDGRSDLLHQGSPPRGRGKAPCVCSCTSPIGITPAWAGKSSPARPRRLRCQDHPRVGGEKSRISPSTLSVRGSPPRGRGKGVDTWNNDPRKGITPAWAGKSTMPKAQRWANGDHPRVGGEKDPEVIAFSYAIGSPPRGRGKDTNSMCGSSRCGITPAWAGKSLPVCSARRNG